MSDSCPYMPGGSQPGASVAAMQSRYSMRLWVVQSCGHACDECWLRSSGILLTAQRGVAARCAVWSAWHESWTLNTVSRRRQRALFNRSTQAGYSMGEGAKNAVPRTHPKPATRHPRIRTPDM